MADANASGRQRRYTKLLLATARHWNADNASMWAASLAFYTMLSLGPLIFLAVTLSGLCLGEQVAHEAIMRQITMTIGPQAGEAARNLALAAHHSGAGPLGSLVGLATLLFGASGVFAALQDAMDAIWHVTPRPDAGWFVMLRRRFLSLAMVAGVAFLLMVSFVASAAFAVLQDWMFTHLPLAWLPAWMADTALSLGVLTLAFGAMYKVLPDARLKWRDVWLGAAATAVLFHAGKLGLGFYLTTAHVESAYGAAGSLALILIWVYYAAQILFMGAEFIRARLQSQGKMVQPAEHAMATRVIEIKSRPGVRQSSA